MTFNLPNRDGRKWAQPNYSDLFGIVARTKNINFDDAGYLTVARRSRSIYDADQDADFGHAVSIIYWPYISATLDEYYVITNSGKGFIVDGSTLAVVKDTNTYVPTFDNLGRSDMEAFGAFVYASAEDGLHKFVGNEFAPSGWSAGTIGTADNGGGGPLCLFVNKNMLAWGDGNTVKLYTSGDSLSVTLTLPTQYWVTSIAWSNNYLYIGTRHRSNGEAHLFTWDGADTTWNNSYGVGTHRIDCVKPYKDSVALVTSEGQLLKFNGGAFGTLGNLPIHYKNLDWDVHGGGGGTSARIGRVLHRGMVVEGEQIFINLSGLINHSTNDTMTPRHLNDFPSGIWCYDPDIGLYHRSSLTGDLKLKTDVVTTGNVNLGTDIITVSGQTVPPTGTPVIYDDGSAGAGTLIAPLKFREKYYVIYVSNTTMKLASTKALADAGTALDLTATGNDLQYFIFLPNRDFGGSANSTNGAICLLKKGTDPGPIASDGRGIIFSGYAGKTTTDLVSVLNVTAEKQENRGHVVTVKLPATKITDDFLNLTVKYKGVKTAEDTIRVKFRVAERDDDMKFLNSANTQTATWTDANTFTTTADLSLAEVGDEIEFARGTGAGYTVHISSLSESSGTWTVNIDENIQGLTAGDTSLFYIDNWEYVGAVTTADNSIFTNKNADTYTSDAGAKTFSVDKKGEWVQFKIELRGEDVALYDLLINNKAFREFTT